MKHSDLTMRKVWELKILDVADKLDIKYAPRGSFRKCHCFMHNDKTPSMWFKLSNNTWSCPVCKKGGGIVSLVEEHEDLKFPEAVDWLINAFNIPTYDDEEPYRPPRTGKKTPKHPVIKQSKTSTKTASSMQTEKTINILDSSLLKQCQSTQSVFCQSLVSNGILTESQMQDTARRYHLGRTRDGGVIFWQIDNEKRVRDGKIMFYLSNCHRDHDHNPSSVSYRLIRQGKLPKDWTATHCLFGLHLVSPKSKIIAVVESEKTALICSELIHGIVWLATGGKSNLTVEALRPLQGHKVIVFPDTDTDGKTFSDWSKVVSEFNNSLHKQGFCPPITGEPKGVQRPLRPGRVSIYISNLLEKNATPDQKQRKIDIADFLIENQAESS